MKEKGLHLMWVKLFNCQIVKNYRILIGFGVKSWIQKFKVLIRAYIISNKNKGLKMFKKIVFILVSLGFSIASVNATDLKIGTVDLQKIFAGAPQRTIIVDKIKKQFEDKSNALKALGESIEKKRADAQRDAITMTDEQKIAAQRELQEMATKAQTMQKNLQEDFQRAQQVEGQKLQEKIGQTIQKIAKEEKFDLILRSETIAFQTGSLDISNKVITILSNPAG